MKLTLENTDKIVELNGVPARIWEGTTESGIPVHCYVTRLAVPNQADHSQFEQELREERMPSLDVQRLPYSLIL